MNSERYMQIISDMSGSQSKNRFRNEVLWGLSKVFDVYNKHEKFAVVFDYVCDVELHYDNSLEFYQMKTDKNTSAFTLKRLTKHKDSEKSILGQLYLIKKESNEQGYNSIVAVVSNIPLRTEKLYSSNEYLCMGELSDEAKLEITKNVSEEFGTTVDVSQLDGFYYVLSSLDLFEPQDTMLGKTIKFYSDVMGEEPVKPRTLFNALEQLVKDCACYEKDIGSYEELIQHKALTKEKLDLMLHQYSTIASLAVEKTKNYIEEKFKDDYLGCIAHKKALNQVVVDLQQNLAFKNIEQKVLQHILKNLSKYSGNKYEIASQISLEIKDMFGIEHSSDEQMALVLLTLTKVEEGAYEKFDN